MVWIEYVLYEDNEQHIEQTIEVKHNEHEQVLVSDLGMIMLQKKYLYQAQMQYLYMI
jgi:hypothetical protein